MDAAAGPVLAVGCPKERTVKVLDLATGTVYFSFTDTAMAPRGQALATLGGPGAAEGMGGAGDYVVTSQANEHALVFHRWGKTQPVFKCKTPEQVTPVLATPDGLYVLAGGRSGRVYMWEAASGSLLRTWDAHFKAVTCMAVSSDGGLLFTGSEDTLVKAWALGEVLSGAGEGDMDPAGGGSSSSSLQPLRSWAEHSLPVTGLACGQGGPAGRVASCSLDHTARIYELGSEGSVCAVRCPAGLTTVGWDAGEKLLALGGALGDVYLVDLDVVAMARSAARAAVVQTAGDAGAAAAAGAVGAEEGDRLRVLLGHGKAVTALGFSWDGKLVVSASEDGSVRMWDADSLQCVRKVSSDTPGPLGPLLLLPRPVALLEMLPKGVQPAPLQPLKKYKTAIQPQGGGGGGAGGNHSAAALAAAAVQVGGDLAVVLGRVGEGEEGQKDGSPLFWRGGPSAGTPARAVLSQEAATADGDAIPPSVLKRRRDEEAEEGAGAGGSASEDEEVSAAAPAKAKGKGKKGGDGGAQAKAATANARGGGKRGQTRQK